MTPMDDEKELTAQEERLLDEALHGAGSGDEVLSDAAAKLGASVRTMRAAILGGEESASDVLRAKRVATRVLARTRGEDSRASSGVGALLRFAGQRLRDSALVRVAAALLVVQLTLVPLVAWHVFKAPHPGAPYLMLDPAVEEEMLDDLPAEEVLLDEGAVEPLSIDERLARAAFEEDLAQLKQSFLAGSRDLGTVGSSSPVGALLKALTEQRIAEMAPLAAEAGAVETALYVECLVVRFENKGGWQGLPGALDQLVESLTGSSANPPGSSTGGHAAVRNIGLRALAHARDAGVALPTKGEALVKSLADSRAFSGGSPAWLRDLAEASSSAAPEDPYVASWGHQFVRGL